MTGGYVIYTTGAPAYAFIGTCHHERVVTTHGPTTDQRNHYCPTCHQAWTTWPTEEERRAAFEAAFAKHMEKRALLAQGNQEGAAIQSSKVGESQ